MFTPTNSHRCIIREGLPKGDLIVGRVSTLFDFICNYLAHIDVQPSQDAVHKNGPMCGNV